jgi:hypothetical protein
MAEKQDFLFLDEVRKQAQSRYMETDKKQFSPNRAASKKRLRQGLSVCAKLQFGTQIVISASR